MNYWNLSFKFYYGPSLVYISYNDLFVSKTCLYICPHLFLYIFKC
jgi:hypothetical protein